MRMPLLLTAIACLLIPACTWAQVIGQPLDGPAGVSLNRSVGGTLVIRFVNNYLQLVFLDKDQRVIAPPYDVAGVRYQYANHSNRGQNMTMQLTPDPTSAALIAPRAITPMDIFVWVGLGPSDPQKVQSTTYGEEGLTSLENFRESYNHVRIQ